MRAEDAERTRMMSDVDRLTVVIAIGFLMLIARLPERPSDGWSFWHLSADLGISLALLALMFRQVLDALHWTL